MNESTVYKSLVGKTLLLGKEPSNGRLMVGIPIKGKLQPIAIGNPNSVPASVSRYNGEQKIAHVSLEIDNDGEVILSNLKDQNSTFVNGLEIVSKRINLNDTVELGADRYPINVSEILKVADKIISDSMPKEFDITHLESVWNKYHDQNLELQKRARQHGVYARIPMFFTMGAGALSSIAFACGWGDGVKSICVVLTLIGLVIMIYSFIKSKNDTSIEDREKFTEEFQENYICPNPDCGKFLGSYSYKLMKRQYSMSCPHCKCKFIEKK